MKYILSITAALILGAAASAGAEHRGEPLRTLADVLRDTVTTHEGIAIAVEDSEQARLRKRRFSMSLTPEITFQTYGRRSDQVPQPGSGMPDLDVQTSYGYSFNLSQAVYTGGRAFAAWRGAGAQEKAAQLQVALVSRDLITAAAEGYYSVQSTTEAVRIGEQAVVRAQRHLELAEKRLELGEGVVTDRLRAEVNLAEVESDLIGFRNALDNARDGLSRLCGCSLAADPEKVEALPAVEEDVETLIKEAVARRLEREQDRHGIESAEEDVREKKGRFLPAVALTGSYFGSGEEYTDQESGWEAGLTLSIPIYQRASRYYILRESQSALKQAELREAGRVRDISLEVSRLYNAVRSSRAAMDTFAKQVELAEENLRLAEKRFSVGLADSIETVDTQTALLSAEVNLTAEKLRYEIAKLRLVKALGRDLFPEMLAGAGAVQGAEE
jgi:outer membrane protein TolC